MVVHPAQWWRAQGWKQSVDSQPANGNPRRSLGFGSLPMLWGEVLPETPVCSPNPFEYMFKYIDVFTHMFTHLVVCSTANLGSQDVALCRSRTWDPLESGTEKNNDGK